MAKGFNSSLRNYIISFNQSVERFLRQSGVATKYSGVEIYEEFGPDECDLRGSFQGLPMSMGSRPSENVLFTAKLRGISRRGELSLIGYGTEIGYFRQTNAATPVNEMEPIAGYHYDFDCGGGKYNHPVFHAQPKMKAGERFLEMNPHFSHKGYPENKEIRTLRIPTPQMDVFSAIVMVLADHVADPEDPKRIFGDFLDTFASKMIQFDLENIRNLVTEPFFNANPHRIQSWYPKPLMPGVL